MIFILDIHCKFSDEVWCLIVKNLKLADLFNFSIVSKGFTTYQDYKKDFLTQWKFQNIFSFDDGYFDLLCSEMLTLGKKIHEKFKDIIVKNFYVFGVVDLILKKMVSDLLPFSIYCLAFFCERG